MGDLAKLIPTSAVSFIGLAFVVLCGLVFSSFAQEIGKLLYRKFFSGGKEKRGQDTGNSNGIERRAENKILENSIGRLIDTIAEEREQYLDFVLTWKKSHFEMKENIEKIERVQSSNWTRLFEEELPRIKRGADQ